MELKRKRNILKTLFVLLSIWGVSFIANYASTHATRELIKIGLTDGFWEIFFNFVLYYVLGILLALLTFFVVDIFKVKYLTKPIQWTCIAIIGVHVYGAVGYLGMWDNSFYLQGEEMLLHHFYSLLGITIVQALLFLNVWTHIMDILTKLLILLSICVIIACINLLIVKIQNDRSNREASRQSQRYGTGSKRGRK